MIYKDEKLHNKYVINIIFDGASPWNYLQTTEMGSLMVYILDRDLIRILTLLLIVLYLSFYLVVTFTLAFVVSTFVGLVVFIRTCRFEVPDYMRDVSCILVYVLVVSAVVYVDAIHVTLYVYSMPAYMSCVLVYVLVVSLVVYVDAVHVSIYVYPHLDIIHICR